jgi:hypothetical protein
MDSVHPFIALLPSISKSDDAYVSLLISHHELAMQSISPFQYALGRINPNTMNRFHYYARRLRTFVEADSSPYEYHISVTMRLLESRSTSPSEPPLFPSLRSMTWSSTRPELLLFMSADLEALHINCSSGSGGSHALVFLHGLVDQSRRLSTLSISEVIPRKSLELLFKFQGLRTLNISDAIVLSIEKGDLGSLSQLKELTELHISLDAFNGDLSTHPHTLSFAPNLHTLELSGPLSVLSTMIQTVPSTCGLHTVKLSLTETQEVSLTEYKEWLRALTALLDLLSTSFEPTLRHLTIYDHRSRAHDMGSEFNDDAMHVFTCLLSLPQLAHLELTIAGRISLSNRDLERMASAWPELRTLRLSWDTGNHRPNLSSLQVFARHCPKLRHLEYALETRSLPPELGDDVVSVHPLEIFGVLWSSADSDLHATARHLDLLFPQLKEIPYRSDSDWGRIQNMLHSFQKIRRDHDRRRLVTFERGQVYHTTQS